MPLLIPSSVLIAIASLIALASQAQPVLAAPVQVKNTRRLTFPKQFSLGTIYYYLSAKETDHTLSCDQMHGPPAKKLGEARGVVMVPATKNTHLYLFPSYELIAQPEALGSLDPDTFDCICFAKKFVMEPATKVVAQLGHLTGLRRLELDGAELSDKDVPPLKGLINLEYLNLSANALSGLTLKELTGLNKLYCLEISANKLEAPAFAAISKFKNLQILRLNHCGVDDQAIVELAQLDALKDLQIRQAKITKKSIPILTGMKNLTSVSLVGSTLKVKDYAAFAGSKIKFICLSDSQFSQSELDIIKRSLPGVYLSITYNRKPVHGEDKQLFAPLH